MLTVYRIELRRSPLLIALPVLLSVDLAVLFGRSRYWIGVWPEASAATQVVTLFLGPVLAAVSAWQAGRSSRTGMGESLLASPRHSFWVEAQRLAATLTLGFLAYVIGGLAAAAVSFRSAGPGFLWPSYLLLGAATLTLFAAVGHLVGRIWPSSAFSPVVCALGGFVFMVSVGRSYGMFVLSGTPGYIVLPFPITARLMLAGSLAVLAVVAPVNAVGKCVPPRRVTWRSRGVAAGVSTVILATLIAFPAAGDVQQDRQASAVNPLCDRARSTAPRVCVWPEHRKYLPELILMAERMDGVPQPWVKSPDVFYQEGLRPTKLGDSGFSVVEGHVRPAAFAMANVVLEESLGSCVLPQDAVQAWEVRDQLHLWLEYRSMGTDPATADEGLHMEGVSGAQQAAAQAVRQSEALQSQWTSRLRADFEKAGCPA